MNYFDDENNLEGLEIDILEEIDRRLDQIDITYEITEFASLLRAWIQVNLIWLQII